MAWWKRSRGGVEHDAVPACAPAGPVEGNVMRKVPVVIATVLGIVSGAIYSAPAQATGSSYYCFHAYAPYDSYREFRLPLPHPCKTRGYVRVSVGSGTDQIVTVTALTRFTSYARFNAFARTASGWVHRNGAWTARIGGGGMALRGQKIEGDDLTPQGTYGFSFMFGVYSNPGVKFSWRHAYTYDVWDDDPASARYNLWTDERYYWPGINPEPMHNVPAYDYSAVIAYNTARVPGAGSAIFLHVGTGSATAGCVSLPTGELLSILRWLAPAKAPRIAIAALA